MSRQVISRATQFFFGAASHPQANAGKPGIESFPLCTKNYGVIALAVANGIAASQAVGVAALFTINGSLASGGVATFATPRNVVAAWTNTAVITITGTDEYGLPLVEVSASGTAHTGKKAFKTITSVLSSASITGATVGSGVVIGISHRVARDELHVRTMDNAVTTGTFVPADTTTATGTTGDTRGTISFTTAPDGAHTYSLLYKVADLSTRAGAYGVTQFSG